MGRNQRDEPSRAAMTAALTTISTADSNGADYALSALTTTSPYGLATQNEATALIYVIKNLQERMLEVENALEDLKVVPEN